MPGESHPMETRVNDLDRRVYAFEQGFKRLAEDLHGIREDLQDFISVKAKLDSIDTVFKKIDKLREDFQEFQLKFAPVISDHTKLLVDRDSLLGTVSNLVTRVGNLELNQAAAVGFVSSRVGHLIDYLFKGAIAALLTYVAFKSRG